MLGIGRPVTLGIARTMAPPQVWEGPPSRRVNVVITTAWAAAFTAAAISLSLLPAAAPHATTAVIVIKALSYALPALFTAWYPRRVRRAPAR
ncbi:hypothetical protein [Nonomuraea candida]|uniref:hypothetical protein n=1 Tax=Nonomuraea candida TaxID=359159 RepID=UPI00069478FF|nr:hypothetical protein [Nonomuraea candida]